MEKKELNGYVVAWSEYGKNSGGSHVCGVLCDGVYPTKEAARRAIDSTILDDVERELEYWDGEELPEELSGKTPEQVAKEWTYSDNGDEVCVLCANGIEVAYSICKV